MTILEWVETARFRREQHWHVPTFVMCNNPLWDFKFATWRKVTWSRLEEEEGFLWNGVAQFLGVRSVVSSNCNDLRWVISFSFLFYDEPESNKAYFLSVSNEGSHSRVLSELRGSAERIKIGFCVVQLERRTSSSLTGVVMICHLQLFS